MPLISVIIPTYNRASLLPETLDTALAQEFTDFELIVVDDGSTDATPQVIADYARKAPPGVVRSIRQENAGQGAARNRAIAEARGEYCAFLDSDDLFFPWSLAIVAEAIATQGAASVIVTKQARFSTPQGFGAVARAPARFTVWKDLYEYARRGVLGPCGTVVVKTQVLREIGGFLTQRVVGEDGELMLRLGVAPKLIKIEEPAFYGYRQHLENFTRDTQPWYDGAMEVLRRYKQGVFPGGRERAHDACTCVAGLSAMFTTVCLYYGRPRLCIGLYMRSLVLQMRAGNFNHVAKTPIRLLLHALGRWPNETMRTYIEASAP